MIKKVFTNKQPLFIAAIVIVPLAVFILLAGIYSGEDTEGEEHRVDPRISGFARDFDSLARAQMDSSRTPGAALVVIRDSSVIFMRGYGLKSNTTPDSVNVRTVFRLGSVSKGISALLTGLLVQDSLIDWDDKVLRYLPRFSLKNKQYSDSLAIRHLLSHTTGLPYHSYTNVIENGRTLATVTQMLRNVDLISSPGRIYSYQNVAFSLIAEITASVSTAGFDSLLHTKLFIPLHMDDASTSKTAMTANGNHALPHVFGDSNWVPVSISDKYYNAVPAGGMNASIRDMAGLLQALLGNRPDIVKAATLDSLYKPNVGVPMRYYYRRSWPGIQKTSYAMGWRVMEIGEEKIIYHGGYVNSYSSAVALDPENRWAIAILSNAPTGFVSDMLPSFMQVYRRHFSVAAQDSSMPPQNK